VRRLRGKETSKSTTFIEMLTRKVEHRKRKVLKKEGRTNGFRQWNHPELGFVKSEGDRQDKTGRDTIEW